MENLRMLEEKDYLRFIDEFSSALTGYDLCFYIYGSCVSGKPAFGRSDIDGGIIIGGGVVIPKTEIIDISEHLAECWVRAPVRAQFNLLDRQSATDGRFLSYDKSFTDWIKKSGRIIVGDGEMIDHMAGFRFRDETLRGAAYNFRSVRNGFLFAARDFRYDPRRLHENLENAMENLIRLPKKVLLVQSGQVVDDKASAISGLQEMFPNLDLDFVSHVRDLSTNPREWYNSIEKDNEKNGFQMFSRTLTAYEEIIRAYLNAFPKVSDKEVRD